MARPDLATLRVVVLDTDDVVRLVAYREVLREIAREQPWGPAGQLARAALEHFGDDEE